MGNFGSSERIEFTGIVSTVNRASRVQAFAATDEVLISDASYRMPRDHMKCGERTSVTVKVIDDLIGVYCVEGALEAPDTGRLLRRH